MASIYSVRGAALGLLVSIAGCEGTPPTETTEVPAPLSTRDMRRSLRRASSSVPASTDPRTFVPPPPIAAVPDRPGTWLMRRREFAAFFESTGFALSLGSGKANARESQGWGLHAKLVGARSAAPIAEKQQSGVVNDYVGDPSKWKRSMTTYGQLAWEDVWDGVDMVVEPSRGGFSYRFVISPGADAKRIAIDWEGASSVRVVENGRAVEVETGIGILHVRGLRAFAISGSTALGNVARMYTELPVRHVALGENRIGFVVHGWDGRVPLVIDPMVAWSSYLGGSGGENRPAIAVDGSGNVFVTGYTLSSDYPSTGGFDTTYGGSADAFVTKVNNSGTVAWSTYLGGTGPDEGNRIAVDASGNALVTGDTQSTDFPTTGGFDTTYGGSEDGFVTKLTSGGALAWSSYLGGTSIDVGWGIAVDGSGNAYVVGQTSSSNFPSTGGFDTALGGTDDAFVTKVSAAGALVWSSYYGGSGTDYGYAISLDGSGNIFVTGITYSSDFPSSGGFDTTWGGSQDAFVGKINNAGSALLWSSFLGGSGNDYARGLAVDGSGDVFLTGETSSSTTFPTIGGFSTTFGGGSSDVYLTKVSNAGTLLWSSFLGGNSDDYGGGVGIAGSNVFVVGATQSTNFPTTGGFDTSRGGTRDAFVTKVSGTATLLWSSYLGGSNDDSGWGVAVDGSGNAFVVGETTSSDFPSTGGFDTSLGGTKDLFLTKLNKPAANGAVCASGSECTSVICTDGVCCDKACGGTCEACAAAKKGGGTDGTCAPIVDATDPDKECAPQSCTASVVTKAQVCNGAGACRPDGTVSCSFYPCAGTACATSCATDADCIASGFCSGTSCTSDLDPGGACTRAAQCKSGFCADGVCCDKACGGACEACTAAKKGSGSNGTCAAIADGSDPDTECTPQSCTAGVVTKAQVCNGAGACRSSGTTSCGLYACAGAVCSTSCSTDAECIATAFCSGTTCTGDLDPGAACSRSSQCKSGFCVDSVCCGSACDKTCEACTALKKGGGADGTCGPVAADTDPDGDCPADLPSECKRDGMCDGLGACRALTKKGTPCGTTTCTSGSVSGKTCDGAGLCDSLLTPCAPYVCGPSACTTSCTVDTDCAKDVAYCNLAGKCAFKLALGAACTEGRECEKGFCVDSVCCDGGCTGQCEACNESGTAGKCLPITGSPRGKRTPCAGDPAVCGGACDGVKATCNLAPSTKTCGSTCTAGKETPSSCDGLGACVVGKTHDCAPFACADDKTCATTCTTDAQCSTGYRCSGGTCIPSSASKCSADGSAVIVDGKETPCAPTRCKGGKCVENCSSADDCATGLGCNSSNGKCEPAPTGTSGDSGACGCETVGSRGDGSRASWGILLLAAASVTRLRKRRRDELSHEKSSS